jgi:hypothetical protein
LMMPAGAFSSRLRPETTINDKRRGPGRPRPCHTPVVRPMEGPWWGLPRPHSSLSEYFPFGALSTSPQQGELGVSAKRRWGDTSITLPLNVPISSFFLQVQIARER